MYYSSKFLILFVKLLVLCAEFVCVLETLVTNAISSVSLANSVRVELFQSHHFDLEVLGVLLLAFSVRSAQMSVTDQLQIQ